MKSIIELAGKLEIEVVAEGIETEAQLTYLKNMKCQLGQGYLFARPLDVKSVEGLIMRNTLKGEQCTGTPIEGAVTPASV